MNGNGHRPRITGVHHPATVFHPAGWSYTAACDCGARTHWNTTWSMAMFAAGLHIRQANARDTAIEQVVAEFREQLAGIPETKQ